MADSMTKIINLSEYRNPGNGAREAIAGAFGIDWLVVSKEQRLVVDHFLATLWMEGFKVVPVDDK